MEAIITSPDGQESLNYKKVPADIVDNYEEYERFIQGVEHAVRAEPRYTDYIAKLKSMGMDRCAILGNLKGSKVNIEMHHGPIMTMFDICDVVVRHLMKNGEFNHTTFEIANIILEEHRLDNIQVVMLSKSPHKAVDTNYMFIHTKMSFGRIDKFIEKYKDGLIDAHFEIMESYIRLCKKFPESQDNGLFDVGKRLSFKGKK